MNSAFVVFGIALFGMCYFILQEEIRAKASQVISEYIESNANAAYRRQYARVAASVVIGMHSTRVS